MATVIPSSSLQSPSSLTFFAQKPHSRRTFLSFNFINRATDPEATPSEDSDPTTPESDPDSFDDRLSKLRLKYRSGTGKKAELRKVKKGKKGSSGGSGIYLPPVPLKEATSGGLKVDFGFSPYSERVNGRLAIVGLCALVLVELATGKGVIIYHTPAIVLVQVYFMAAASALYLKYEKEKVSVWPEESSSSSSSSAKD